ncbi:MAG: hypothetical protein WCW13_01120 [archaeon]|jgi:hypothetical protein
MSRRITLKPRQTNRRQTNNEYARELIREMRLRRNEPTNTKAIVAQRQQTNLALLKTLRQRYLQVEGILKEARAKNPNSPRVAALTTELEQLSIFMD